MYKNLTIRAIAYIIRTDWKTPYFGAVPYLDAMDTLESIDDNFHQDSGRDVVMYFLSNDSTWRGEVAREIKAELKSRLNA